jgi:predicted DNA-binding transcriptional regulator AlpA
MSQAPPTGDGAGSTGDHPGQLLVKAKQAAKLLDVSQAHFYRMHSHGMVPRPERLGRAVRWNLRELERWVEAGMPSREKWEAMKATAGQEA